MKFRICSGLAALVCMTLASCYPYDGQSKYNNRKPKGPQQTGATAQEDLKIREQQELKKAADEEIRKKEELARNTGGSTSGTGLPPTGGRNTTETKRDEFAFANKVPGKEGFVFSPFNNKVVDVRDIPSGTLVQDPTYPASEKKYFRVP